MPEDYIQEPAEVYGDQLEVTNRLEYPYVRIPHQLIIAMPVIGRDAFVVYTTLMYWADNTTGVCWPPVARIRHFTGFGRNRLFKALRVLVKYNILERSQMRKGKEFGANRYVLLPVEEWDHSALLMESPKWVSLKSASLERRHKLDPGFKLDPDLKLDPEEKEKEARARADDFLETGEAEQPALTAAQWQEIAESPELDPLSTGEGEGLAMGEDTDEPPTIGPPIPGQPLAYARPPTPILGEQHAADVALRDTLPDACEESDPPPGPWRGVVSELRHMRGYAENDTLPDACKAYHPGFACPHMQAIVEQVATVFWPGRPVNFAACLREFRNSKGHLWATAHDYAPDDIELAAQWWKAHKPPRDRSLPLFFSQIASAIGNATVEEPLDERQALIAKLRAEEEAEHAE